MNQYSLALLDIDSFDNKYYYKVRITTNLSSLFRDVRVRFQDISQLHKNLQSENYSHYFPQFPEKSLWSSWFSSNDSREDLLEYKPILTNYLNNISRNQPIRNEPIMQFVANTFDPARTKELKFLSLTKEQLFKQYSKTSLIKKGKFCKVLRVMHTDTKQIYTLKVYRLPKQSELGRIEAENFKRAQGLITDNSHLLKVYEVGTLQKGKSSFFNKKQKKTVYNSLQFPSDTLYEYIYSIEELAQQPMNEIINLRRQSQQYFELEQVADAIFTLVQTAQYLQFLQVSQKQFLLSNLYYSEQKGFKIGCMGPTMEYKRKYYLKYQNDANEIKAMTPPESNNTLGYKIQFPSNKSDVWQIGIIILCMTTLSQANEVIGKEMIETKIKMMSQNYGETMGILVRNMLENSPYDRQNLQEIWNGCQAILPMKLNYINLKPQINKVRLKIHNLSMQELEDLDKYFREKQDQQLQYTINLILDKDLNQTTLLFYLERIRKENIQKIMINLHVQELPQELMQKIGNILKDYDQLEFLSLNLAKSTICDQGLKTLCTQLGQLKKLQNLILDLRGTTKITSQECVQKLKVRTRVYND